MEKLLDQIAAKILALDESSLTSLLSKYKEIMDTFEPTPRWEKAVLIYFIINSVRVKNALFNENILKTESDISTKKNKKDPIRPFKLVK